MTPGDTNQVRFGRIPSALQFAYGGANCYPDPNQQSGFGYSGATTSNIVNGLVELGRFSHFNRTIERGARQALLDASLSLRDPATGDPNTFCADRVDIFQETPFSYVEMGVTSLTIEVAGFARGASGTTACSTGEFVEGQTISPRDESPEH